MKSRHYLFASVGLERQQLQREDPEREGIRKLINVRIKNSRKEERNLKRKGERKKLGEKKERMKERK